jgi:uncharacterized membrane protein YdjX (TVP38/TMEM64 family)
MHADRRAGMAENGGRRGRWRFLPLVLIGAAAAALLASGAHQLVSIETLRAHHAALGAWVGAHWTAAAAAFVALYAAATVLLPPSGTVMTIAGGFLFGWIWATGLVVVGATGGATILFVAARRSLAEPLRARAGSALRRLEAGFRDNAMSYMLVLRLVPLFPFWLVNVAPAFLGVSLKTYVVATVFGIIPGTAVYAAFGAGLGGVLAGGGEISLAGVLTPEIIAALVGLAVLSLLPVAYRRYRAARAPAGRDRGEEEAQ